MRGAHYVKLVFGKAISTASSYLSGVKTGTRYCSEVVSAVWLANQMAVLGKLFGTPRSEKLPSIVLTALL